MLWRGGIGRGMTSKSYLSSCWEVGLGRLSSKGRSMLVCREWVMPKVNLWAIINAPTAEKQRLVSGNHLVIPWKVAVSALGSI